MLTQLRSQFGTAGLVVAIIALIAALAGGAYAASGGLTGKQKKEVTKIAKQNAGKPGAPGAVGPVGPAGSAGPAGPKGDTGSAGGAGSDGKSVEVEAASVGECIEGGSRFKVGGVTKGKACNGEEGSPWTAGGKLPSGATETGVWGWYNTGSSEGGFSEVSFTLPLAEPILAASTFKVPKLGPVPPECDNGVAPAPSVENPEADPGKFCVFIGNGNTALTEIRGPGAGVGSEAPGLTGALLTIEGGTEGDSLTGSWAVTGK